MIFLKPKHVVLTLFIAFFCSFSSMVMGSDSIKEATQLLDQAAKLGSNLEPPGHKIDLYKSIARVYGVMGLVDRGIALVDGFGLQMVEQNIREEVLYGRLEVGDASYALGEVGSRIKGYEYSLAISFIVKKLLEMGQIDQALRFVDQYTDDYSTRSDMGKIFFSMVMVGQVNSAIQKVFSFEDDWDRAPLFQPIAKALIQVGLVQRADILRQKVVSTWEKESVTLGMVEGYCEQGNVEMALKTSMGLEGQMHAFAVREIAVVHAEKGNFEEAIGLAISIPTNKEPYGWVRHQTLGRIAEIRAQKHDYPGAFETVRLIPEEVHGCDICGPLRDEIIGSIGKIQVKQGHIQDAMQSVKKINWIGGGDEILVAMGVAQAELGHFPSAIKTVALIQYEEGKAKAISEIAEVWVKREGQFDALSWVNQLSSEMEKAYGLVGVAKGIIARA